MNGQPRDTEDFRNLMAFLLVGAFVTVIPLFVFKTIPDANKDVITYMVGQLSGMALLALGFYFTNKAGEAALDKARTENTGKALDAIAATANSTPSPDTAGKAAEEVAHAAVDKAEEIKGERT